MSVKRTQVERREQTRRALLDAAGARFAAEGYAATATEEVVRRAGVTRGALYHHFRDKRDLFLAVVEDLEVSVLGRVQAAAAGDGDPWRGLRAGLHAFLDACMEPAVQRILLLDAPAVLGWAAWRELEERYGVGLLREAFAQLIGAGLMAPRPVEALAHMLLGALSEGGLLIAGSDDPAAARRDAGEALDGLLRGLRDG